MKIALFGGAFNPPTKGHQQLVEIISEEFDEVWILPCNKHVNKKDIKSNKIRLEMLNLITFKNDNIKISDFEIRNDLNGKLYETMELLKSIYRDCEFYIIIGSDNLDNIETFFNYENLIKENNFKIIVREGYPINFDIFSKYFSNNTKNKLCYDSGIIEISSSYIRDNLNDTKISDFLDSNVLDYINKNKIY